MAKSIIDLTRGIPTTTKGWLEVFARINKFLKVSGDQLQIDGEIQLPPSAGNSVLGRAASTPGSPVDIVAGTDATFLRRTGSALGFTTIIDSDIPGSIARTSDVSDAIAAHEAAVDPHPDYLTQPEGDARYREHSDAVTYGEITDKPAVLALLYSGTGTPEAAVVAGVGSLFLRTDGGASTTLYIKETGAGNTGWVAK